MTGSISGHSSTSIMGGGPTAAPERASTGTAATPGRGATSGLSVGVGIGITAAAGVAGAIVGAVTGKNPWALGATFAAVAGAGMLLTGCGTSKPAAPVGPVGPRIPENAVDVTALDANDAGDVHSLVGMKLGRVPAGVDEAPTIGEPLFGGRSFATRGDAMREFYNTGRDGYLVTLGAGDAARVVAYAHAGWPFIQSTGSEDTPITPLDRLRSVHINRDTQWVWGAGEHGDRFAELKGEGPAILKLASMPADDPATAKTLVGSRIGEAGNQRMNLGEPLLGGPVASREEAAAKLWEAGDVPAAIVEVDGGVLAFRLDIPTDVGGRPPYLSTSLAMVEPRTAVSVIRPKPDRRGVEVLHGTDQQGYKTDAAVLPPVDAATITDAATLTGMRIGIGADGAQVRLEAPIATHPSAAEATEAARASGARELLVAIAGGATARFDAQGVTRIDSRITPMAALGLVHGPKAYKVDDLGSISFDRRLTPFAASEPIGRGFSSKVISAHLGSHPDLDSALATIRGNLADRSHKVVLEAAGPGGNFHVYDLRDGDAPAWDTELGAWAASASYDPAVETHVDTERREQTRWGTDVITWRTESEHEARVLSQPHTSSEVEAGPARETRQFEMSRIRAFDPTEPIDRTVQVGTATGNVGGYVRSFPSFDSARAEARARLTSGDRASVVLERENSAGRFHLYEFRPATTNLGAPWDGGRADVKLATTSRVERTTREVVERQPGTFGLDAYTYRITNERKIMEEHTGSGTSALDRGSEREVGRELLGIDPARNPNGGGTSPGDSGGRTSPGDSGGRTSPGDSGGRTSPGDSGGTTSPGDS